MNKSGEETILSLPERHNRILALLQQNGSISVVQLAELFKVSEVTIRKDLSFLEQQKKLYRTHGSAILISPYISDRHVNEKEKKNVAEKRAIGAKAASLVAQDDSIIIASGTTMAFLAREIKGLGLTGIDYSMRVLRKHPEWVEQAKKLGLEVNVWTVDEEEDMRYFIDLGVDYITTDYPERLQALLK